MKGCEKYLIVMVTLLCLSGTAMADSALRCGTHLVSIGDNSHEVIRKCGKPAAIDSWEEKRVLRDFRTFWGHDQRTERSRLNREPFFVTKLVKIEMWTYNFGFYRFVRYLKFENDILKEITTGEKGYWEADQIFKPVKNRALKIDWLCLQFSIIGQIFTRSTDFEIEKMSVNRPKKSILHFPQVTDTLR